MPDICTDLDNYDGTTEPGCGVTYSPAQLHTTCCHRTFGSASTADTHDSLREQLGKCPTDAQLKKGTKRGIRRDEAGVWRAVRDDRPKDVLKGT